MDPGIRDALTDFQNAIVDQCTDQSPTQALEDLLAEARDLGAEWDRANAEFQAAMKMVRIAELPGDRAERAHWLARADEALALGDAALSRIRENSRRRRELVSSAAHAWPRSEPRP